MNITYWARILSQKLGLFLISTEAERVLLREWSRINLSLATWILFSAVWRKTVNQMFFFFQCQCQRLTYNLGETSNRTSITQLLINANNAVGEMNLLTSLFQSGFWLFVRCNASISGNWFYLFVRNIWLTGNILGSDLFRLIPRCRGGFRLVLVTSLFLSFMASFTQFFFWSTWWAGKSLSRAKTSQT